ncbi:MAG: glutamate--cysteine ligase [Phycisphaerae bacterium]|jgi:gamma-glutamyl:cysteine ligase YbdK (ATP-grasp superfamily)|nr:glutamate--cysteine ligase [Phycisphaerae bacterium]
MNTPSFHLFERYGVELEYMLVQRDTLDVAPLADVVLRDAAGETVSDVERDGLCWSNELALHVLELKTARPAPVLAGLAETFQRGVHQVNALAAVHGAVLLPSAMHPWMDPHTQTRLWPHDNSEVYAAFNRVFDCRGHGWSNLQSVHLNLPFAGDEEFGRLHAAIRLLLPLMPALAASSPIVDGRPSGLADTRLEVYRRNCARVPLVTGRVIPEPVFTREQYERGILRPMYAAIAPHDPEGVLQHEWLNARGAIARFDRSTIEIRVLDVQECPQADLAVVELLVAVLRAMVHERWAGAAAQRAWPVETLERVLLGTSRAGGEWLIEDEDYLLQFGCRGPMRAAEVWRRLAESVVGGEDAWGAPLLTILTHGTLSARLSAAAGAAPAREHLRMIYRRLSECLRAGTPFVPAGQPPGASA